MKLMVVCVLLCAAVVMASPRRRSRPRNCHEHREQLQAQQDPERPLLGAYIPSCEDDGTYSAVQCRGSVCQCHSEDGRRIRGYGGHISQFSEMTCSCARAIDNAYGVGLTHTCDPLGNFTPIQCRGSMCYCADTNGEQLYHVEAVGIWQLERLEGQC